jgi:hypothetical protein
MKGGLEVKVSASKPRDCMNKPDNVSSYPFNCSKCNQLEAAPFDLSIIISYLCPKFGCGTNIKTCTKHYTGCHVINVKDKFWISQCPVKNLFPSKVNKIECLRTNYQDKCFWAEVCHTIFPDKALYLSKSSG